MLTVHKMPLKNHFLTGISSVYDKTPNQNELQHVTMLSFTGDCVGVVYVIESYRMITCTSGGTEILCKISSKSKNQLPCHHTGYHRMALIL